MKLACLAAQIKLYDDPCIGPTTKCSRFAVANPKLQSNGCNMTERGRPTRLEGLLQSGLKLVPNLWITHHQLNTLWAPHVVWHIWIHQLAHFRILHGRGSCELYPDVTCEVSELD